MKKINWNEEGKTISLYIGFVFVLFILYSVFAPYFSVKAASYDTGWLDADTFTTAGTGVAFTNPSNAVSSNNLYAQSVISDTNNLTQLLSAKDFDIVIPDGMQITGIQTRFERKKGLSSIGAGINDYQVVVIGCTGTSWSYQGTTWPASDAYQVYGSDSYLWDLDCTEAEIESVNFGFGVRGVFVDNCDSYPCSTRAQVDHMQVKIHYRDPLALPKLEWLMAPFVLGAQAAECTFTQETSSTTTAICDDPVITNTTQDIGTGILIFFIFFFGLLFYFRKAD